MESCWLCQSELSLGFAVLADESRICLNCLNRVRVQDVTELRFNQSNDTGDLKRYRRKLAIVATSGVLVPATVLHSFVSTPYFIAKALLFLLLVVGPLAYFLARQCIVQELRALPRSIIISPDRVEIISREFLDSYVKGQCRVFDGKFTFDTLGIRHEDRASLVLELPWPCASWNQHLRGRHRELAILPWKRYRIALGNDVSLQWCKEFWQLDHKQ